MKRQVVAILMFLALSGSVFAHEGEKHILGKVAILLDNSMIVETTGEKPEKITIVVTPQTKFIKSGDPAAFGDLKVGERVVIHAKENGKKLVANQVSFGKPKPPSK